MALSINTALPSLLFSSQLPDVILSATYAEVVASLTIGGTTIFSTTLYPYNGTATFADIRAIVEDYLVEREQHFCTVQVVVTAANGSVTASSATASVVFCAHALPDGMDTTSFLRSHFLTTNTTQRMARTGGRASVYGIAVPGETVALSVTLIVERSVSSGNPLAALSSAVSSTYYSAASTFYFSASYSQLLQRAQGVLADTTRVLAVTVWAGTRSATFFCSETTPDITFFYFNPFGCFERIPIYGTTQTQDEKSYATAVTRRNTVFYDIEYERIYKTKAAGLSETVALQLLELLAAPIVRLDDPAIDDSNDYPALLVEAIDCEPSNKDDGLHEATIEWRFADRRPRLMRLQPSTQAGIFTSEYNNTFS